MATDSDAASPGHSTESIVTACGYLSEQAALEREAAEVLSGKFDECTFDKGYVNQPLYACLTCTQPPAKYQTSASEAEPPSDPAGMCYSCSIECHAGHNVIELFTKRNFCCDCGTQRLLPRPQPGSGNSRCCQLKKLRTALAETENTKNKYNHNFWGFYCRCDKFYDASVEPGVMIQCFVCNDWFHNDCIGKLPKEDDYTDYICRECIAKYPVLRFINSDKAIYGKVIAGKVAELERSSATDTAALPGNSGDSDEPARKKARSEMCRRRRDTEADAGKPFDMFMADGWKEHICTCIECMHEIERDGLVFLLKEEEVVEPEEDDTRTESLYESALRQLQTMDRTRAVDAAAAYHSLSSRLKEYLRPFAVSGAVVTGQDIRAFFDNQKI
ncbi:hypothetical protein LPJ78_005699 [Coemansia sp. RSA 989]|nr:hypothetical protein LPJ68_005643 [Coemansia sp. RSA 1086]KAJ1860769.1 hypothetical protein LPJ78_005699 [Coemansia sp. RSA 989]KAJ1868926.1 hypothetical protein LPJ55_005691 [Coemansia sp. RSA 990]